MSQREHPIRAYVPPDLHQWVAEMAKQRRCSVSHFLRDLVAKAKEDATIQANAVTSNHPVLTEGGWKQVSELAEGEQIAIWNPETKMIELHPVRWDRIVSVEELK